MKPTSVEGIGSHGEAIQRGWVAPSNSGQTSWVESLDNNSGTNIVEGNVVVVLSDGTIQLADTVNEARPTGVALDDIDDGASGLVCFGGPVEMVITTGSVTAGDYGQTSTTPGEAQAASGPATAFCMFIGTGDDPPAFLWGGRGGGGFGGSTGGSPDVPCDLGNLGATETLDVSTCTWHRGTLNADCTFTVSGFTVDEALLSVEEITEDGTGGWGITWDTDVLFVGDDQPDTTAGAVTFFLLWTSAGDSTVYGARVGAPTVAALDDLTDVTITSPAADQQLQYVGGVWVNNSRRWEPVTSNPGTGPEIVFDGDDIVMTWATY